ncbi:WXG100 family type VII secretion target [Mycolicibacterium canariasense]|nr:WXG100 family type VII secretion target [Mycolicibacterium canariasense]
MERTVEGHGGVMERPVEVVVSDLHLASGRLRDAGQRLQDGLSSVDLETRELLGSGWKGGAASAFSGAWDQWHNGAGQVIRGIQTMSELLRVAADQYARADEQGAGAIASASPEPSAGPAPAAAGGEAPSGAPVPTAASTGPASAAGSASPAGAAGSAGSASGAAASGVSDAVSQVGQLGGQVSSGLAQAAQAAAGMAQQVGQAVEQIVEQAVQQSAEAEKGGDQAPVEPPPSDAQPPSGEVPR